MATITLNDKNEISILQRKIEDNIADYNDYKRYEFLLDKAGKGQEIRDKLKRYGYNNFDEYYTARKSNKPGTEGEVLGVLLGVGLVTLLLYLISNKK